MAAEHEGEEKFDVEQCWSGIPPLEKDILSSEHCFLYDSPNEIFLWYGKKTSGKHRKFAEVSASVRD